MSKGRRIACLAAGLAAGAVLAAGGTGAAAQPVPTGLFASCTPRGAVGAEEAPQSWVVDAEAFATPVGTAVPVSVSVHCVVTDRITGSPITTFDLASPGAASVIAQTVRVPWGEAPQTCAWAEAVYSDSTVRSTPRC